MLLQVISTCGASGCQMPTIDSQWLQAYMALELACDIPIYESLHHILYHLHIQAVVDRYLSNCNDFPWNQHQDPAVLMALVKENGRTLCYVKEQTEELCLAAVRRYGWALCFVKEQTEQICLAAVRESGHALYFVKEQTEAICLAAVQQNPKALQYIHHVTPAIAAAAAAH